MMHLLGSLFKSILSPISDWLAGIFYSILVKAPLEILNFINASFLFLTGQGTSRLLFGTSLDGGHMSFDFMSNPSPVQKYYFIMFALAGGMGILFLSLAIVKAISTNKQTTASGVPIRGGLNGVVRLTGGTFLITVIPVIVLGFLSLVSAISGIFAGAKSAPPNPNDITQVRMKSLREIDKAINLDASNNYNASPNEIYVPKFDKNTKKLTFIPVDPANTAGSNLLQDGNNGDWTTGVLLTKTPVQFDNFHEFGKVPELNSLETITTNRDMIFNTIKGMQTLFGTGTSKLTDDAPKQDLDDLANAWNEIFTSAIFTTKNGATVLSKEFKEQLTELKQDIMSVTTDKSNSLSTKIMNINRDLQDKMYKISDVMQATDQFIQKYEAYFNLASLEQTLGTTATNAASTKQMLDAYTKNKLLFFTYMENMKQGMIMANINNYASSGGAISNPQVVSTLGELMAKLNIIINGDGVSKLSNNNFLSTTSIAEMVNPFETAGITVTMYHLATGNADTNWHSSPHHPKGARIFIAFIAILAAIVVMTQLALFAAKRIFDIGVLFIISPIMVVWSTADEGRKLKSWLDLMIAKVLSIVAVVISLRVLDVVLDSFDRAMRNPNGQIWKDTSNLEVGSDEVPLFKTVTFALMAIAGLQSAKMGAHMVATLFGSGAGLESIGGLMSGAKAGFMGASRGMTKVVGGTGKATTRGSARVAGLRGANADGNGASYGTKSSRAAGLRGKDARQASVAQMTKGRVSGTSKGAEARLKAANSSHIRTAKINSAKGNSKGVSKNIGKVMNNNNQLKRFGPKPKK